MTPQLSQPADKNIDAELDRLTYSAYLLTLDPGLALSVVMAALDASLGKPNANLLGRTVELSLQQLRREANSGCDRECSAAEVVLYGEYQIPSSSHILRLNQEAGSNLILSLTSGSRIAFVLHHMLDYTIKEAAVMAHITEKECCAHLRNAYLQLASSKLGFEALARSAMAGAASA
jgi:DNA-directed RNA polymerase specialized sigma24 family protein